MKFYSVVKKKSIDIPEDKVRIEVKNNRRFAVGKYEANGKSYEAYKILGMKK